MQNHLLTRFGSCLLIIAAMNLVGLPSAMAADQPIKENPLIIQMAMYYAPEPTSDPLESLSAYCAQPSHPFRIITIGKDPFEPAPALSASWLPLETCPPPTERAWQFRARDLPENLRPSLIEAKRVLVLVFCIARSEAVSSNERISQLIADLADATGGMPWDEESRTLFSAKEWRSLRVDSWQNGIPDMRQHIVLDAYKDGEFLRMVTLGMRKFALPDLVAAGVTEHASRTLGNTMNACAQSLAEGVTIDEGRLSLDFAAIKHDVVRSQMRINPLPGSTGKSGVSLKPVDPKEGDANNVLLDVDFTVPGENRQERCEAAMASLFGASEKVISVKPHDAELYAARARARLMLPKLRERFLGGLRPKEHLAVKGPFTYAEGKTEYMWVEISSWAPDRIAGTLLNEPSYVKGIRAGSHVTVDEADVFDYIWSKPDGTQEGNETGKILERLDPQNP